MDPFNLNEQQPEHLPEQPSEQPRSRATPPPLPGRRLPASRPPAIPAAARPLPPRVNPALQWWDQNRINFIIAGVLLLIVSAFYSNSFLSGWVLDNQFIIVDDPRLKAFTFDNIGLIFTKDYWWPKAVGGLYRPLTTLSYLINWTIGEKNPFTYHLVNLIFHWLNAVLTYLISRELFKRLLPALAAGLIFATHPIATESVTNIIGRADLFSTTAVLGGLLMYIIATRQKAAWKYWLWFVGVVVVQGIGLLCKESAAVLFGAIVLYDITFRFRKRDEKVHEAVSPGASALGYLAFVPLFVLLFVVRHAVAAQSPPMDEPFLDNPIRGASFLLGRLTAMKVLGRMLWLLLWPVRLCCDYAFDQIPVVRWPFQSMSDYEAIISLVIVLAIFASGVLAYFKNRKAFFFVMFLFMAYMPTSNFLIIIGSNMAERFMYLPLVGFAGLVAMGIEWLSGKIKAVGPHVENAKTHDGKFAATLTILIPLTLAYGVRTFIRNFDWKDDVVLWTSALPISPNSFRTHEQFAFAIYLKDPTNIDAMIAEGEKATGVLNVLPDDLNNGIGYIHLGKYYGMKADTLATREASGNIVINDASRPYYEKARAILEKAKAIDQVHNQMNRETELKRGRRPEQIQEVGLTNIYEYLSVTYDRLKEFDKSLDAALYFRRLQPLNVQTYIKVASAQLNLNRIHDATVTLVQVVIIDGSYEQAWQTLAQIYRQTDAGNCTGIVVVEEKPRLNTSCDQVRRDVDEALREMVKLCVDTHHWDEAREVKRSAIKNYNSPPVPLNKILPENLPE